MYCLYAMGGSEKGGIFSIRLHSHSTYLRSRSKIDVIIADIKIYMQGQTDRATTFRKKLPFVHLILIFSLSPLFHNNDQNNNNNNHPIFLSDDLVNKRKIIRYSRHNKSSLAFNTHAFSPCVDMCAAGGDGSGFH